MSKEEWVTICNVRTIAEHYKAVAAGKKDSFACNVGEIAESLELAADMLDRLPRWIPVGERLPEHHGLVLVAVRKCLVLIAVFKPANKKRKFVLFGVDGKDATQAVTHWMPLPKLPKVTS